jgi:hypothetical protein
VPTPPNVVNSLWINTVDINGVPAAGMWTLQDQSQLTLSPYSSLLTATQALSLTDIYAASKQQRGSLTASAASGPYCTAFDQAVFVVQSSNSAAYLVIPGPVAGIFKSDHFTIDLTNPLVQTWWTAVQAILGDSLGSPWTQLKRGYRRTVGNLAF